MKEGYYYPMSSSSSSSLSSSDEDEYENEVPVTYNDISSFLKAINLENAQQCATYSRDIIEIIIPTKFSTYSGQIIALNVNEACGLDYNIFSLTYKQCGDEQLAIIQIYSSDDIISSNSGAVRINHPLEISGCKVVVHRLHQNNNSVLLLLGGGSHNNTYELRYELLDEDSLDGQESDKGKISPSNVNRQLQFLSSLSSIRIKWLAIYLLYITLSTFLICAIVKIDSIYIGLSQAYEDTVNIININMGYTPQSNTETSILQKLRPIVDEDTSELELELI